MTGAQQTVIERFAGFSTSLAFSDLPAEVVEAARFRILDVLGSALWGVHAGTAAAMRRVVEPVGGSEQATLIGRPMRLPATQAAYLNSCASPALLDTCRFSVTHPGIVTIPAALAVAEQQGASGRDLITAVVAGYEVLIRLGRASRVADRGFVPTAVWGAFASATASARLMRLDERSTCHALALAATKGAGLLEAYVAIDSARNQFGRACQAGVLATSLAQEGVVGNLRILEGGGMEGTRGFFQAYNDSAVPGDILQGLGTDYGLPRVAPKMHDGCRYTNAAADAVLDLVRAHGLRADDVRCVRVRTFALALNVSVRHPTTASEALFCLEYVVAVALLEGNVSTDKFTLERLQDPAVRTLMAKVEVALDQEIEHEYPGKLGLLLEVDTVDGRLLSSRMDFPRGEPENPMAPADCEAKFLRLASPLLGTDRAGEIVEVVSHLDALDNISSLMALSRPKHALESRVS
jgi:2-methylcitrate dehydratase PrpD